MSPSESSSNLNRWIPKLEAYRAAFDQHASDSPLSLVNEPLTAETVESRLAVEPNVSPFFDATPLLETNVQIVEPSFSPTIHVTPSHPLLPAQSLLPEQPEPLEVTPIGESTDGLATDVASVPSEVSTPVPLEQELQTQQKSIDRAYTIPFRKLAEESSSDSGDAPMVLHLPIDGIVKSCRKARPFLLGFGSLGQFPAALDQHAVQACVARELALRIAGKIDAEAMVIQLSAARKPDLSGADEHTGFRDIGGCLHATWYDTHDPRESEKIWYRQLAELSRWKQQFGLIVIDLGDAASPIASRVGRLCHGLVIQLHAAQSARKSIQAISSLKKQRLNILGVWSTEPSTQRRSA